MISCRFETFFLSLDYTVILEACKLWDLETNLVSTSVMTTNATGLAFAWVELCRGPLLKHRITIPRSVQPTGHSLQPETWVSEVLFPPCLKFPICFLPNLKVSVGQSIELNCTAYFTQKFKGR